jgi:hypothetical protein
MVGNHPPVETRMSLWPPAPAALHWNVPECDVSTLYDTSRGLYLGHTVNFIHSFMAADSRAERPAPITTTRLPSTMAGLLKAAACSCLPWKEVLSCGKQAGDKREAKDIERPSTPARPDHAFSTHDQ